MTAGGRAAPVVWMGRQTVSRRFAAPLRVLPVRIRAGALGEGLPRRDLLVSPDYALFLDGVLVHAGALVNGSTIRREADVPERWTYWHVELAYHALVLAEGVAAESFVDHAERMAFDNWAKHQALHPRDVRSKRCRCPTRNRTAKCRKACAGASLRGRKRRWSRPDRVRSGAARARRRWRP